MKRSRQRTAPPPARVAARGVFFVLPVDLPLLTAAALRDPAGASVARPGLPAGARPARHRDQPDLSVSHPARVLRLRRQAVSSAIAGRRRAAGLKVLVRREPEISLSISTFPPTTRYGKN